MREISTKKALEVLLIKLDQMGIPREKFIEGFPVTLKDLNDSKHRLDWEVFVPMLKRYSKLIGGPAELERAGLLIYSSVPAKLLGYVLSIVKEPKDLYWALATGGGQTFFSNIQFQYEDLGENQVRITLSIPPEYTECPEYFQVCKGTLAGITLIHHLPYAIVEMEADSRKGVYTITIPPSMTFFKRLKRALMALKSGRGIIEELRTFQRQIDESYVHLADTKKKLMEHELKLKLFEKLVNDSRLAALDRLAGGVGHEINNPLMIITLNAQELESLYQHSKAKKPKELKHIEEISKAKERIAGIVTSLMAIGSGSTEDAPKPVKIESMLDAVKNLSASRFEKSGIDFQISTYDHNLSVTTQQALVSQALVHLLNNAFDAALQSQEKWIRIEIEERQEDVLFKVIDSGAGIPPSVAQQMFNPFFSTKDVGKGVGLGLSLARKYIEMQESELLFDTSNPNTCFTFALKKHAFKEHVAKKRPRRTAPVQTKGSSLETMLPKTGMIRQW